MTPHNFGDHCVYLNNLAEAGIAHDPHAQIRGDLRKPINKILQVLKIYGGI
jgi:hypothetical protein